MAASGSDGRAGRTLRGACRILDEGARAVKLGRTARSPLRAQGDLRRPRSPDRAGAGAPQRERCVDRTGRASNLPLEHRPRGGGPDLDHSLHGEPGPSRPMRRFFLPPCCRALPHMRPRIDWWHSSEPLMCRIGYYITTSSMSDIHALRLRMARRSPKHDICPTARRRLVRRPSLRER